MFFDPETQASYAHNGKLMLGLAILLFLLILTIILLHTYRHSCFRRRHHDHRIRANPTTANKKDLGLHPSLLNILPTFTYSTANHHPLHDSAICLSEFDDGDEGRVFPNRSHAFHSHCIEAWLRSHSSCPLCRTPVHQYAAPVQPPQTPSFDIEPGPIGCSSFPAPIGCPRNPLELVGIIVEMEDERLTRTEAGSAHVTGYHGLKGFRP